jgi:hypothetical protein
MPSRCADCGSMAWKPATYGEVLDHFGDEAADLRFLVAMIGDDPEVSAVTFWLCRCGNMSMLAVGGLSA